MDLAGQISLGAAAVALFLAVGKSYINYIGRQLTEERGAHERELARRDKEIERLTAIWESRLSAEVSRGNAWQTAAQRHQEANHETTEQLRRLTPLAETTVNLLMALRDQGRS